MKRVFAVFLFFISLVGFAQQSEITLKPEFLRGSNNQYRNFWDVQHYDLTIKPNFEGKSLQGNVIIDLKFNNKDAEFLQLDLQKPMQIDRVEQWDSGKFGKSKPLEINKEYIIEKGDFYFIPLNKITDLKDEIKLKVHFSGKPKIAKQAPWDGGWIFTKDSLDRPWLSLAVQGLGASAWFPCKDYQGDEPDNGANIHVITGKDEVAVANGKLWKSSIKKSNENIYNWEVKNPINTYNITPNIGHYVNFKDEYIGLNGKLDLDYWVLDYNLDKAKKQFQQVPKMLKAFEYWFGAYPFYEDSYKLVETPFLGMEHQSNIAYGNKYQNGYLGMDRSGSGYGNLFDFIIIHESGHEWFGNNITTEQIADMWIHEAFTTYAEALFVEYYYGKEAGNRYVQGYKNLILNDIPLQGKYDVHQEGSGTDMYYKGANVIHTLRQWINDDAKFLDLMRGLNKDFRHKIVTAKEIEDYIAEKTNLDLSAFWEQYIRTTKIPKLVFDEKQKNYRWENAVDGFNMPVKLEDGKWLYPTTEWNSLAKEEKHQNLITDNNFLVESENIKYSN
ncbi:M1 family metallopeptidase [Weeksellaceae bacterium TAE3-ERU29]|nr:M1 family metallopeptidase [Weeksellaceae bacterium TAE3-ERU29]